MSSYQVPLKRNNEFSSIFNSIDYDVNASSKSDPIRFNDSRYLRSSGSNISSNAIITNFNSLVTNSIKSKQNIDSFTPSVFSISMIFDFNVNMIFSMDISVLQNSSVSFLNIPITPSQTYIFTFLIKPTLNSKFFINPLNNIISVNEFANIPIYGISNVSLPNLLTFIIQQITIINTSSTAIPNFISITSVTAY